MYLVEVTTGAIPTPRNLSTERTDPHHGDEEGCVEKVAKEVTPTPRNPTPNIIKGIPPLRRLQAASGCLLLPQR